MLSNLNITEIEALITVLYMLAPVFLVLYHIVTAHLPANKRAQLEKGVRLVVQACEQVYSNWPGASGAQKKASALSMLNKLGVKDSSLVEVLLESAVLALPKSNPVPVAALAAPAVSAVPVAPVAPTVATPVADPVPVQVKPLVPGI